jgi:uncharacterized protein (DUF427 family)
MTLIKIPGLDHAISVEPTPGRVTVRLGGRVLADTENALTLREAEYPPVQYVPLADVAADMIRSSSHTSYCPYKGVATYYDLVGEGGVASAAAWTYAEPHAAVAAIRDHVAFYPDRVDSVEVQRGEGQAHV